MNIIIAGGRDFNDYELLKNKCNEILLMYDNITILILSGDALGADKLGERYSLEVLKKEAIIYKADWKKYGKTAGFIRNKKMANNADMLIAFWDGKSKGTKHMIEEAMKKELIIHIIPYQKEK